jgi:hypothetical protein
MAAESRPFEFLLVQYVPDIAASARLNVGVVLFERTGDRLNFATARFVKNLHRLVAFHADADIALLGSTFRDIEERLEKPDERDEVLRMLLENFSNMLQVSGPKTISVVGNPTSEADRLTSVYLPS